MGIFIKNFEAPKKCIQCIFFDEIMLGCNLFSYGCIDRYKINPNKKQDWCELINVSIPHGRLIDVDALLDKLGCSDEDIYVEAVLEEEAPIIIEAEGE